MTDGLVTVRAALDDYRRNGPAWAAFPPWKVTLAKRLMDSIMFTGDGMVAYLCGDGSVLIINDLGLSAHEDDILIALYDLFIEWGFPREMFFTPLHAVMDWLDCDEEEAIAVADQLDLEDLSLLTRRDYDDWVAYAAGHIPATCESLSAVIAEALALRERRDAEALDAPPDDEIPF
jgi:hypothetical protein